MRRVAFVPDEETSEERLASAVRRQIRGEDTPEDERLQIERPREWRTELADIRQSLQNRLALTPREDEKTRKYLGISIREVDTCLRHANDVVSSSNRRRDSARVPTASDVVKKAKAARRVLLKSLGNLDPEGLARVEAYAEEHGDDQVLRKLKAVRRYLDRAQPAAQHAQSGQPRPLFPSDA